MCSNNQDFELQCCFDMKYINPLEKIQSLATTLVIELWYQFGLLGIEINISFPAAGAKSDVFNRKIKHMENL